MAARRRAGVMTGSSPDGVLRLAMWSGPRNISTAFMRSWGNRDDTLVVDEPFYAHYLRVTGVDHPGRDEVIAAQENDWRRVVDSLVAPLPAHVRIYFQKQMAHHLLPHMGRDWLGALTHAFLIREPHAMVVSLGEKLQGFDLLATGLPQQVEIFEHVVRTTGRLPPVIEAADLLANPDAMLREFCRVLGVPFSDRMLWWPAGRRATDGVWAKYWYERVESSTGFESPAQIDDGYDGAPLPPSLARIAAECRPLYERLRAHRLRVGLEKRASRAAEIRRTQPQPHRQHQRRTGAPRQGPREPVRFGRAGRRCGLGRLAAVPGPHFSARAASRPPREFGQGVGVCPDSDACSAHARNCPHTRCESHVRWRAYPADTHTRRENHVGHGSRV